MARKFVFIELRCKLRSNSNSYLYYSASIIKDFPDCRCTKRLRKLDLYRFLFSYTPTFFRYARSSRYYSYHYLCSYLVSCVIFNHVKYRIKVVYK